MLFSTLASVSDAIPKWCDTNKYFGFQDWTAYVFIKWKHLQAQEFVFSVSKENLSISKLKSKMQQ